ncbi:MAG: AAA family ATPase [Pontiella sp.]
MKILELRFKNLNSLVGEWCIDFTDPAFVVDGLFAITGPTGSGKTTILDAICLALYGQTPRLGKMTSSDNEVMSRQTGECFAEVLFEAAEGRFRATWHQHRSRKKAGGALQSPKREISNEQGELLAEKLKEVQDQIDRISGMPFDRFTRSILLAQGSFDVFLKANADARSPILEQITGTEIYTDISKAVHERNSQENLTLNQLNAALGGIQLLNKEELEQMAFDLNQVEEKHREEARKRDAAKAALDCIDRIQTLETALEENRSKQKALREENNAFKSDAECLAAARRAQPLAVDHAKLVNLRTDFSGIENALKAAIVALPELEERKNHASTALEAASHLLAEKEAEQKELVPLLKEVRVLDTQIARHLTTQESEVAGLEQVKIDQAMLRGKEVENRADLAMLHLQLNEAESYQQEHVQDAELIGQCVAMVQSLEHVEQLTDKMEAAQKAWKATASAAKKAATTACEEAKKRGVAQQNVIRAEALQEKIHSELLPLLDGTDWRARLEALRRRITIEQRIQETRSTLTAQALVATAAEKDLVLKRNEQESLLREHALLIENLSLQQKIESLEVERAALADGQPCPLCGALAHPFAAGLPAPETSSIEKTAAALAALANQINVLTEKQAAAKTLCATLQATLDQDEAELETLVPGNAEEAEAIAKRIEHIETLEQREKEAQTELDRARETQNQKTLAEQTAKQTAESAGANAATAAIQQDKAAADLELVRSQLEQTLEPFGIARSTETARLLMARRDQWVEAEKKTIQLTQTISNLQTSLTNQTEQLENQKIRIQKQMDTLAATQSTIDSLKADREALFGNRQPDILEQEFRTAIDALRKTTTSAQTQWAEDQQALFLARQNVHALEQRKQETQSQLDKTEPAFTQVLSVAEFKSEAAYLSAYLDPAAQSKLETREDELKHRHTYLSALATEKTQQLQDEQKQNHGETSPEEYAAVMATCNGLQQQIGDVKSRIAANEKAQALHAEKIDGIEKQKMECNRWNALHELIGSADGKKFRNFAQGLTFELMVSQANQQLSKMSDRYLLIRDSDQPLDLNVVDNYQAGEIRPVKNLSGGESFIVSLSLALGLSKMASKTIRVDSLFLDEGFGTLDEDALETALGALAELKQDGKLIGVISHVGALKERIGTQINVQTESGGRSTLSGTGVSAL